MNIIVPGCIVLCQGASLVDDLIRRCTGDGWASHAGMITRINPTEVTEALAHGVVTSSLTAVLAREKHVKILWPPLRHEQMQAGATAMLKLVGTPYAWGDIILQLGDAVLDTNWLTEHWDECNKVICSMADAIAEPSLGLIAKDCTPNDLYGLAQIQRWPQEDLQ